MGCTCDLGSDMRFDAGTLGSQMEAWGTVNPIAVEKRHGRHMECGAGCGQILRQRGAFEETESGAGMKLDVHQFSARTTRHRFPRMCTIHKPRRGPGFVLARFNS